MAEYVDHVPTYPIRWLRPAYSTAMLDLPTAPIDQTAADVWRAFSEEESIACEEAWQKLPNNERIDSGEVRHTNADDAHGHVSHESQEDVVGVAIYKDRLYEVDVRKMLLQPVYWRLTGKPVPVKRANCWMYDETRPVPEPLNSRLEAAYRKAKPWLATYAEELRAALTTATTEAHEKLKRPLESENEQDEKQYIVFQDGGSGRVVSDNLAFRVQQSLYSSFLTNTTKPMAFPGTTPVYRGYEAAEKAANSGTSGSNSKPESRSATPTHGKAASLGKASDTKTHQKKPSKSTANEEEQELVHTDMPSKTGEESETTGPVTDLVFIVHGIGQNLSVQYESLNFTYAANLFRQVARKQSALPELSGLMRSNRIQFLPLQWRASFGTSIEDESLREEEGLDNHFSLADITLKESIPFIRELANNVILDVPYFMSSHREAMIHAVCTEANAVYRKWCRRNPDFEHSGRVHIIAHSLGSALVTHVLSNQPTNVVPLSERKPDELMPKGEFIFDTSALFVAGSPLAMFMLLDQRQLIARKGRVRTKDAKPDEAIDRKGVFGCLAVDSIYNVFYPSDPIAYRLNPVVDQRRAHKLPPSAITAINASFIGSLSSLFSMPSMPSMPSIPSMPSVSLPSLPAMPSWSPFGGGGAVSKDTAKETEKPSSPPTSPVFGGGLLSTRGSLDIQGTAARRGSATSARKEERAKLFGKTQVELQNADQHASSHLGLGHHGHHIIEDAHDDRARRRFAALNPHGTLDFFLPAEGAISEYIDMVTAHLSYWSDSTFASFVLAEIFAKQEDRSRAGEEDKQTIEDEQVDEID